MKVGLETTVAAWDTVSVICWQSDLWLGGKKRKRSTSEKTTAMNGHEKLSKAQKRWEQANQCLSVTTSVTCDNTPQKIPTAVLEQPIQPSFNCSALKKCFLCERQNKGADEKLPLRIMYFFAFFLLLSIQQLVAFTFHSGQRHPINIARSVREDPCLSQSKTLSSFSNLWLKTLYKSQFLWL